MPPRGWAAPGSQGTGWEECAAELFDGPQQPFGAVQRSADALPGGEEACVVDRADRLDSARNAAKGPSAVCAGPPASQ
jgi:hypothetical protein